jgi:hypothetical protein
MKQSLQPLSARGKRRVLVSRDDGRPLLVVRPSDPAAALAVAERALRTQETALLESLPETAGDYTVQGWLGKHGAILDRHGDVIGNCKAGDSFITIKEDNEIHGS